MPADSTDPTEETRAPSASNASGCESPSPDQRAPDAEPSSAAPPDRAVVDRIVDGAAAVLLVGPDEHLLELPSEDLPTGAADGTWLVLDLAADPPEILGIDQDRTDARRTDAQDRLQRLRRTRSGGRFD